MLPVRPAPSESGDRYYFSMPGATEAQLADLRDDLRARGASAMHVFFPNLIVCELPLGISDKEFSRPRLTSRRSDEIDKTWGSDLVISPRKLEESYKRMAKEREERRRGIDTPDAVPPDELDRSWEGGLRLIPPEVLQSGPSSAQEDPQERNIYQNSEIMAGNILIQLVLPEHINAQDYPWYQRWDVASIEMVKLNVFEAINEFQSQFRNANIAANYRMIVPAPVGFDPIRMRPQDDTIWISDFLTRQGIVGGMSQNLQRMHAFNSNARVAYRTDWVFTAFIVPAMNDGDHEFTDARFLSWSYLGGPYLVTSHPVSSLPVGQGVKRAFVHEMGHQFWGLEEALGSPYNCDYYSGYLNVRNRNAIDEIGPFGGRGGCGGYHPEYCPMVVHDAYGGILDFCPYSSGMFGTSDIDSNLVPDAFDAPPIIDFISAEVETVTVQPRRLDFQALGQSIPNMNPFQQGLERRNYAAPVKDVSAWILGSGPVRLLPLDGIADELVEEFTVLLPPFLPGVSNVEVTARNTFNATSEMRTKSYLYVDLEYFNFAVDQPNGGTSITWGMIGATFDAKFDLHRANHETGEDIILAEGLEPVGPSEGGILPYAYFDAHCQPGVSYDYYVRGEINLPYRGGILHKVVNSGKVETQAASPRIGMMSQPTPNPSSGAVWLSLNVPASVADNTGGVQYSGASGRITGRIPTDVSLQVYDVRGRLVREVYKGSVLVDVITLSWDGRDEEGRAVPTGIYFLRGEVADEVSTRKVLIMH